MDHLNMRFIMRSQVNWSVKFRYVTNSETFRTCLMKDLRMIEIVYDWP